MMDWSFLTNPIFWVGVAAVFYLGIYKVFTKMVGIRKLPRKQMMAVSLGLALLFATGGFGGAISFFSGTASLDSGVVGELDAVLHDGYSNDTATEDYLNDAEDKMTIYSADANIEDNEYYKWNITLERSKVADAGKVEVVCSAPDMEISGTTEDSLIDKTDGETDLTINGGGTHETDTTVSKGVTFDAGEDTAEVEVKAQHVEAYHDAMSDMDTTYSISCQSGGVPVQVDILANS